METLRQRIRQYLLGAPRSLREISQELRISEKEALDHIEHLAKAKGGARLAITPARCLACGYVFKKRERPGRPGRCPVCRSERLSEPLYSVT